MNTIGANYLGNNRCFFSVWAPEKKSMHLHITFPVQQTISMERNDDGYFTASVKNVSAGTRYFFRPEDKNDFPDPASHYQPEGVHGPSEVFDHTSFTWNDQTWQGLPFQHLILYELHVGTFTKDGTFEAIIPFLDELVDTGINALEIMPVSQFPGKRNWGYDGVFPYAVQNSYGGPTGLKKLIDACHQKGIAVFLDVVYNHLGPEGNYFKEFGPYFTKRYCTPWGDAINLDDKWADGVREYFTDNALYWFEHFHVDGLRLDAIHTVFDSSATHFWKLLHKKKEALEKKIGRSLYTIAESDLNDPRVVQDSSLNGFGFTAQWLDDFHHALYALLDPNGKSRYTDFGKIEQLAKAYVEGFVHAGEYVNFRKRKYGASSAGISGNKFIVFNLNHDQAGNRVNGERLSMLVDFERLKIAAASTLLSPYIPMLFMGEEYGDESPFFYFVDHSEKALIKAVQEGRKEEFEDFKDEGEPRDPQDEKTFTDSILNWNSRKEKKHAIMLRWHKALIALRQTNAALQNFNKQDITATPLGKSALAVERSSENHKTNLLILLNFSDQIVSYETIDSAGYYKKILDSTDIEWSLEGISTDPLLHVVNSKASLKLPPLSATVYTINR